MTKRILLLVGFSLLFLFWLDLSLLLKAQTELTNPTIMVGSFLGGEFDDRGNGIAVGSDGSIYVAGLTQSTQFPTSTMGINSVAPHGEDAYIVKFSPDGRQLDYIFWFNASSGSEPDEAYGLAVDDMGNAYVTGRTRSSDFCSVLGNFPGFDTTYNGDGGDNDAFLFKINAEGTAVSYCTFLGGSNTDIGRAVVVDSLGRATVTGGTWSSDFPITPDAYDDSIRPDDRDVFVARLDATGTMLEYATYVGGTAQDEGVALTLDTAQNIYVTGWTFSDDFPTTANSFATDKQNGAEGFVFQLAADGSDLIYSSFLGGNNEDRATAIAVDDAGHAYIAGYTQSPDFPVVTGSVQITHQAGYDGFILKMTPTGDDLLYSTFLGGGANVGNPFDQSDQLFGLAVNNKGQVTAVGETRTTDFPITENALQTTLQGESDLFVSQLTADGSAWLFSSYIGGSSDDEGVAVAIHDTSIYVTGQTDSSDFPTSPDAYNTSSNGFGDVFVLQLGENKSEPLTAVFSTAPEPTNLYSIAFNNESLGTYMTSTWSFGDGMTSTLPNPTHLYQAEGTYTVTLTIANQTQTATTQQTVQVNSYRIYLPVVQRY